MRKVIRSFGLALVIWGLVLIFIGWQFYQKYFIPFAEEGDKESKTKTLEVQAQIKELENLSSYGILLVVLGHSYVTLDISGDYLITFLSGFREFIYSFHMPLFIFISGFKIFSGNGAGGRVDGEKRGKLQGRLRQIQAEDRPSGR